MTRVPSKIFAEPEPGAVSTDNPDEFVEEFLKDIEDVAPSVAEKGPSSPQLEEAMSSVEDQIGLNLSTLDGEGARDEFFKKAVEQAFLEAEPLGEDVDPENFLDREDLKQKIVEILDAGNEKLMESIQDLKEEQVRSHPKHVSPTAVKNF